MDHKPLTFCMSKVAEPWSARQQCQLAYVYKYTMDIRHIAGKSNVDKTASQEQSSEPSNWAWITSA